MTYDLFSASVEGFGHSKRAVPRVVRGRTACGPESVPPSGAGIGADPPLLRLSLSPAKSDLAGKSNSGQRLLASMGTCVEKPARGPAGQWVCFPFHRYRIERVPVPMGLGL